MRRDAFAMLVASLPLSMSPAGQTTAPSSRPGTEFKVEARVQAPRIIAVRIHHDMCPHCKQLKPRFEKLAERVIDASVLLVTLDLTNAATQQQAALVVGALGLESVWTGDLSRIGTVTFLGARSKETLVEFRADGAEPLETALQSAIQRLTATP